MPNPLIWGDDPVREVIIVAVVFLLVGIFNAWKLGRLPAPKWLILCGTVLGAVLVGGLLLSGK